MCLIIASYAKMWDCFRDDENKGGGLGRKVERTISYAGEQLEAPSVLVQQLAKRGSEV